jgi:protein-tyrosine-phosphatase
VQPDVDSPSGLVEAFGWKAHALLVKDEELADGKDCSGAGLQSTRESRARLAVLDGRIVEGADLVVVMDRFNEAILLNRFPQSAGKNVLLGRFAGKPGRVREILDPYGCSPLEIGACYSNAYRN